ncbi:MAG: UvrD-helicase domain-containing protein [Planctomycetaceae bacterium]
MQQRRALETRGVSVALSAGAGCGKTFVLTRRYLDALHPGNETAHVSRIVAITFTDRAAREMRDRIRGACADRLRDAPPVHRRHWQAVAREIDSARIGTIHSFCAGLLRTYAVEAGVDPDFAVAEADVGRSLLRRAVTDTVRGLLTEHNEDCMQFVLQFGLERAIDLLIALTQGRFHSRITPPEDLDVEARGDAWLALWNEEFVPQMLRELQDSHAVQRVIELLGEHIPQHAEMRRRCELLLGSLPNLAGSADPQTLLQDCRAAAQVRGGGGKSVWGDESAYRQVMSAFTEMRKSFDKMLEKLDVPEEDVRTAAEFSVIAERLLHPVLREFEERKRQAGLLDFDDLLLEARRLLRSSEAVRRRVAAGIDFLMIDEFQDTDPVQAEIVRDICGDALLGGKLFLVGDAKQSIYRFRRADPSVFAGLRQEIPESGRLPLSHNFRSQPAILDFVNALFSKAMGDDYEPLVPYAGQLSPTPSIEFLFSSQPPGDGPPDDAEDRRKRESDWLARRVASLLQDETPRIRETDPHAGGTRLRRVQPGDVAVRRRLLPRRRTRILRAAGSLRSDELVQRARRPR